MSGSRAISPRCTLHCTQAGCILLHWAGDMTVWKWQCRRWVDAWSRYAWPVCLVCLVHLIVSFCHVAVCRSSVSPPEPGFVRAVSPPSQAARLCVCERGEEGYEQGQGAAGRSGKIIKTCIFPTLFSCASFKTNSYCLKKVFVWLFLFNHTFMS